MRRRSFFALTIFVALAGAAGLTARTLAPPGVVSVRWMSDDEGFGGWSGIDVADDGVRFWAVSDRSVITTGTLQREGGQLVGIASEPPRQIREERTAENVLIARDAEGISVSGDGKLAISYERFARVWRYDDWKSPAKRIDQSADFAEMGHNGSLEAVATLPDGTILTLPELPPAGGTYPVFLYDGRHWNRPFALSRDGFWRAVGADVGPDGMLYLLERQFLGVGFISRIRRFDLGPRAGVLDGDVLYRSPPGRHGNLEGIGTWRDGDGHIRAVLVTDDNFLPFQRSEIVEVILPD